MTVRIAALLMLLVATRPLVAQETFGRVTRGNGQATLTVFDGRPLERAAQTLAHDFGVQISVEDPLYLWESDLVESHRSSAGKRVMVPKPRLLDVAFRLGSDGRPDDVRALLAALIERSSVDQPLGYRVDVGPGGYTIVPTQMRDERGNLICYSSPLDVEVTLPRVNRPIAIHAQAIVDAVERRTAVQMGCCTGIANNFDLNTRVDFGVEGESARHALQRLHLLRPWPTLQHMRCQPKERWCFVNWTPTAQ
jgi:hypothetical protein